MKVKTSYYYNKSLLFNVLQPLPKIFCIKRSYSLPFPKLNFFLDFMISCNELELENKAIDNKRITQVFSVVSEGLLLQLPI